MVRFPNLIVVGQGKAGTSLLYRVLEQHPSIGLSSRKELHFFNTYRKKGLDWYLDHFAHILEDTPYVGEISPAYLKPDLIRDIAETLGPETKVIFILRRPIERAYSRYLQNICATQDGGRFTQNVRQFDNVLKKQVLDGVDAVYDHFNGANILPLFFERDICGPDAAYLSKIIDFLGLDPLPEHVMGQSEVRVNSGVMPRYIFSGDDRLHLHVAGEPHFVPRKRLIFCAQDRNSTVIEEPSDEQVLAAFQRQSKWSGNVTIDHYRLLQENSVLGAADRLEQNFGFDMSHWRNPPKQIIYQPAPVPIQFLKRKKSA